MNERGARPGLMLASLLLGGAGCGFGHSIERPDAATLVENLGADRYTYHLTRLVQVPARGPAAPVVGIAPAGSRELGVIEVVIEYSGGATVSVRDTESQFYPILAQLAGEMGGTHFLVLRSTRENRAMLAGMAGGWISSLTVDVIDAPTEVP